MFNKSCLYFIILFIGIMENLTWVAAQDSGNDALKAKSAVTDSIDWLSPEFSKDLDTLYELTGAAPGYGLSGKDFMLPRRTSLSGENAQISRNIHSIAVRFFSALAYGSRKPSFNYEGISIEACTGIQRLVVIYARSHQITSLADSLKRPFAPLLQSIRHYQAVLDSAGFKEIKVNSTLADPANKPLVEKLYQLGFLKQKNTISAAELIMAVREAQKGFALLADGKIRSTFIMQLNVPLATRLLQCRQALNDMRWLSCLTGQEETILVNIPSAYMHVYRSGTSVLEMKMVVGKPSTPTPVFSSRIEQVILYPYWHVPYSIATKELLPLIKLSPAFIDKGGYQVLNAQGKIMDPYRINWKALGPGNFPYLIRQSTGCDNALGLLKLDFYTPFGVYLHDTPSKNSFNLNKRYFSHGCMRMEKPVELGRMILQENTIAIDTLTAKGCLINQSPIPVTALHKMALVVWYNVAAIDPSGSLVFYEDVYKKFNKP